MAVPVPAAAAAASEVAKDTPRPEAVLSTSAHGITPLFVVAVAPVWPTKVKPAPEEAMVEMPAAAAVPRLVPRKRAVAPGGGPPAAAAALIATEGLFGRPRTKFVPP